MRYRSILILGVAGMLVMSACSSAEEGNSKLPARQAASANNASVANGTEVGKPLVTDANITTNVTAPEDQTAAVANRMDGRLTEMRKSGDAGQDMNAAALALKNAKPAPDNSTFASYLTDAGYEIRTFKNHPQLLRVEKKVTADGKGWIKVFLRGGRVIDLPGQRISPLSTAPAVNILEAAGVRPVAAAAQPGSTETKKPSQ